MRTSRACSFTVRFAAPFKCMQAVSADGRIAVEKSVRPQVDEMVRQAVNSASPAIYAMA